MLLAAAGVVPFLLGIVGLDGVVAYALSQRRREIGLRMALGARPGEVTWLLVRRGMTLTGIGVAAGLVMATFAARFLASLLFQTSPVDPATYLTVSAALLATAAVASVQPAWRATRICPAIAMRRD
jgi:putative ABC transport system permease protein